MAEPPGQGLCLAAVVGSSPSEPRLMSQRFPQVWTKWDSCVHIAYIPLEAGAYRSQVPSSVRTGGRRKPDKGASGLAPPTVSPPPPAPVRFGAPCCWGCRIAYTSLSSVGRGVAPRIHSPSIPWRLTFRIKEALAFRLPTGLRCATGLWGRGWRGIERRERRSWGTSVPLAAFAASLPQGPRLPPGPTEPLLWVPGATPPRPSFGLRGRKGPHWAKGASPALTAHSSVNRC